MTTTQEKTRRRSGSLDLPNEEREREQLWRPNTLNLNTPVRDYSLDSTETTPVSLFGKYSNAASSPSKYFGENADVDNTNVLLSVRQLAIVFGGLMIVLSLVAIDQTIIVTALPTIVSDFDAVSDISWIASAFYISQAGSVLFFGKIITISSAKWTLLVAITFFELGNLFCAISRSIDFLIFGRAVSGVGAAGIYIGIMSSLPKISTLKQRPILMNCVGAVFAIFSITGPLFGGIIVGKCNGLLIIFVRLTFEPRQAFMEVGAVGTAVILFTFPNFSIATNTYHPPTNTFLQRHRQLHAWLLLDWIGIFLSFASVILFLLGLQTGGDTKPWSDGAVIAPLVLGILLFIGFVFWEIHRGSRAIVPVALLKRRNVLGACCQMFLNFWGFRTATYYLPLLYQIRGHSAEKSGIDILWYMVAGLLTTMVSCGITVATGHIWILMCLPQTLAVVGFGLLSTTKADTSFARLAGLQILLGLGLGAGINNPIILAQADLADDPEAAALATTLVAFSELMASGINAATNGAILSGVLHSQVSKLAGDLSPDLRAEAIASITFALTLPDNVKGRVIEAYINAIDRVFLSDVVPTAVSIFTAFIIERKKISVKPTS